MSDSDLQPSGEQRNRYLARTRALTIAALLVWFIFSLVVPWFAPQLDRVTFLGFPLGYYMIAQGSLAVFVVSVFWLNRVQDRIDDEFGPGE